jgi:hypothetical protein
MNELDQKMQEIEKIHTEYLAALHQIEEEQRLAIKDFLEKVKEQKIAELKQQILSTQNHA